MGRLAKGRPLFVRAGRAATTDVTTTKDTDMDPLEHLIGKTITNATVDTLTLSDGTRLRFDREDSDCCSWIELRSLSTTANIITAAEFRDTENDVDDGQDYRAWLHVVTEAGELNIAEAEGNAGNGYYLHGFALGVTVLPAETAAD